MKYYSDITNEVYETLEALNEAESKANVETKKEAKTEEVKPSVATDNGTKAVDVKEERKLAAKAVETAFANASNVKRSNEEARKELDKQIKAINAKYDAKIMELDKERQAEEEKLSEQFDALDKADSDALQAAYKELLIFNQKYGTYHYSVDNSNVDIFPLLFGFNSIEKLQNSWFKTFNSMFNLF